MYFFSSGALYIISILNELKRRCWKNVRKERWFEWLKKKPERSVLHQKDREWTVNLTVTTEQPDTAPLGQNPGPIARCLVQLVTTWEAPYVLQYQLSYLPKFYKQHGDYGIIAGTTGSRLKTTLIDLKGDSYLQKRTTVLLSAHSFKRAD